MKKLISRFGLAILMLAALSARALTVTPEPGVSGQSTPQSAFLPIVPSVKVTDTLGLPVAGAQVKFSVMGYDGTNGAVFFTGSGFSLESDYLTTTDVNGIATSGLGPLGYIAGASGLVATATSQGPLGAEQASASIPITVTSGGTTTFVVVSGSKQKAEVGTPYASPWVAQALDGRKGVSVPNAAVLFYAPDDPSQASVTFDGKNSVWVRADANGIATSPVPVANMVEGSNEGFTTTLTFGTSVTNAFFGFTNTRVTSTGGGGGGDGCGAQRKGNGNCGNGNGANHGK